MKETDDASKERLEALRQEIAEVQEKLNVQKAGWLNQKNAIDHVQELKGQLDEAKSEEERATRSGDLGRASELRYSVIPGLQQQIQDSEAALEAQKQQDGEGLNEQVTSDEIAEVVSAWTGVPVSKMMQGELDKLKGLEGAQGKKDWDDYLKRIEDRKWYVDFSDIQVMVYELTESGCWSHNHMNPLYLQLEEPEHIPGDEENQTFISAMKAFGNYLQSEDEEKVMKGQAVIQTAREYAEIKRCKEWQTRNLNEAMKPEDIMF